MPGTDGEIPGMVYVLLRVDRFITLIKSPNPTIRFNFEA
jgi:hypothetical protein